MRADHREGGSDGSKTGSGSGGVSGGSGGEGRSRRRGEELYAAIFEATLAELTEVGYARLAMERVAARAGAGKMSLYKRWPTRAELVVAALRHDRGEPDPVPDTGDLREDVLALLRRGAASLNGVFGVAARGLMAETLNEPTQTATVRATMFTSRDRVMREILDRAVARGDIAAEAVTPQTVSVATALVDHYFLTRGTPIPDEVLTGIVDGVLLPLLAALK